MPPGREPQIDPVEWSTRINPQWLSDEDRAAFEEDLSKMPMRTLLKRYPFHIRQKKMDKVKERMMKDQFSVMVLPLSEDSAMSGADDDAGYLVVFYYEPKDEQKVIRGLKSIGIDITKQQAEPIDPEDCGDDEYYFVYAEEQIIILSDRCWELLDLPDGMPGKISDYLTFCDK